MDSRERVIKTLAFNDVNRIPRNLWALPGISLFSNQGIQEFKYMLVPHSGDWREAGIARKAFERRLINMNPEQL